MSGSSRGTAWILLGLFLLSGATGLVYEVLWLRQLILVFGSTLFATSAILSTFMGGLALGAFLAGRIGITSHRHPLRVYAFLEFGVGLYALAVPHLLEVLTPLYGLVWRSGGSESFHLMSLAKFAGIAVVLLPPTTLMGASLPVLSRAVADDPRRIGGKVGTLYAVNTFGAVAGALLAGFVLIPGLGVSHTTWTAVSVNLALGIGAWLLALRYPLPAAALAAPAAPTRPGPLSPAVRLALLAFGLSGFIAMVLEVAWTRALALVLGSSVYAFSLMLAAFLAGLAIGAAALSTVMKRRPELDAGAVLAALLAAAGILAYATAFVLQSLPGLYAWIFFRFSPPPSGWFAVQLLFGLLVMFPATLAFGGIFPAVLQLHARGLDRVARSVGTVYAANTVGTIVGAAVAGFLLVPAVGVRTSIVGVAAVEIALGALIALGATSGRKRSRWLLAAPMIAVLLCVAAVRPGWDVLLMNSGVYMNLVDLPADTHWTDYVRRMRSDNRVLYAREGLTSSVMVGDQPAIRNRYLTVNGKVEASTAQDMETQLLVAHLPLLLHPSPRDVLVIGLASGITAGAAAAHPVHSIRVVEVERTMVGAARLFSDVNGDILDDPRLQLSINDARNELTFSPRTYDVIVSEPSNPWMTVASNLFTEEFFRLAHTRVRPGGIFAQWIQTYCLRSEDLKSIVAAFSDSFRHVTLFETFGGVDLILLGSDQPLRFRPQEIDRRMTELRVQMDLARIGVRDSLDLMTFFRTGDRGIARLARGAGRNTDDNARVEFSAPKALYLHTVDRNLDLVESARESVLDYIEPPLPDAEARRRMLARIREAWAHRVEAAGGQVSS